MTIRTTLITIGLIAASLATVLVSGAAHAALEGRDLNGSIGSFEAYYDTDLDITWLANGNVNGLMNWADANTWAANLSFTDGSNVYDNWRLPVTLQPDATCDSNFEGGYGFGCTGSEMGHLFHAELGGTIGNPLLSHLDPNSNGEVAKFADANGLFWAASYWSSTDSSYSDEYIPAGSLAWHFGLFGSGYQGLDSKDNNYNYLALAVSSGDVGIAAVPEADTWAMLLAGLGLVGAAARRRRG